MRSMYARGMSQCLLSLWRRSNHRCMQGSKVCYHHVYCHPLITPVGSVLLEFIVHFQCHCRHDLHESLCTWHAGIPLRSQVIPERVVEAHTAGLLEEEQNKPHFLYGYKYVVQHHLSRQSREFKGRTGKLFKLVAARANQRYNSMLNKRDSTVEDVGEREGALAQTIALQRKMPYSLHPAPSSTSKNGEAMKDPKVLLFALVRHPSRPRSNLVLPSCAIQQAC